MSPLIAHCRPGVPSKKPGFRVISSSKRRSNGELASNGVGAGVPYVSGSKSLVGVTSRRCRPHRSGRARAPPRALDRDAHTVRRLHVADVDPTAGCDGDRDVLELARPVQVGAVDREHAERRARDGERLLEAVGVDEPKADGRADATVSRPPPVVAVERRDAVEGVRGHREVDAWRTSSRGSMTNTPNSPRRTSCEETWWVWYQNVPTWSARKRYV